jgi:hypothetical protein
MELTVTKVLDGWENEVIGDYDLEFHNQSLAYHKAAVGKDKPV